MIEVCETHIHLDAHTYVHTLAAHTFDTPSAAAAAAAVGIPALADV